MIKKISYIQADGTVPYKNLAMEEYLMEKVEPDECILYLWQNRRTVVIGRNQNCWKECRVETLKEDHGYLARRLSGGGAVFHDEGNLNFTFVAWDEKYDVDRQLKVIVSAMNRLGIKAEKSGRNDIVVDGRKISGNAFYSSGGKSFHHGTILVNTDKETMAKYLNVSQEKLRSKGIDSVKSRVANLVEFQKDITIPSIEEKLIEAFGEIYGGTPQPISKGRMIPEEIELLEKKFASWEWLYGRKIQMHTSFSKRFTWGDVSLELKIDKGRIEESQAYSDSLDPDFISAIPGALKGMEFTKEAMISAIGRISDTTDASKTIKNDVQKLIADSLQ